MSIYVYELQNASATFRVSRVHHMLVCLPFTDGAFKGHFGKVYLERPSLSTVVKLLCLQHVTEIECVAIPRCEVSVSVRCNDDCIQTSTQLHMCKVTSHFGSSSVADAHRYVAIPLQWKECLQAWNPH